MIFIVEKSQLVKLYYRPKDKNGKITFKRDKVSNRRYLTKEDVILLLEKHNLLVDDTLNKRSNAAYRNYVNVTLKQSHKLN